ncbi:MAG: efflux RND transporter periplasmic adaptor subunit [Pelomonas sp.]|nr:efflux RND transporter periplasmic adaptor subunit [Roseateles sp.]
MRRAGWVGLAGVVVVAVVAGAGVGLGQRSAGLSALFGPAAAAQAAGTPGRAASAVPLEFRAAEVVQPGRASLPQTIEFSGPLVAPHTAVLRAKAAGTLLELAAAEGTRVEAGQALGRIDVADLASRIAERHALLESARATLAQAERTQASNERLADQGFISASALDASRAQLDTARAGLQAAQATLDTTRVAQRDAMLVAPIAGIVARRHALPGEKLAVEQPVLTLVDLAQLELAGSVGTHEVSRLAPGMTVQLNVEGVDTPLAGRLARIAPAAEAGTRSIGVTVVLDNAQERMRAGQYALARVELADPQQRMVLPQAAVGSSSGQAQVWLIEQGRLLRRAVTLGRRDEAGGRVEVVDGLAPDAQVLAARFDNLREGAPARVAAGKLPPVASGADAPASTTLR